MDPLLPSLLALPNRGTTSRGEGGDDQDDSRHPVSHAFFADSPIALLYRLFVAFTLIPFLPVLGQHVLSSFCWAARSIPVCAAHTLTGYCLTYLATLVGLLLLSPYWLIHLINEVNEPAWFAVQFAASPVGSLALWWLMDSPNAEGSRLLDPFWILLAMVVGQGIARAISRYPYHGNTGA